MTTLELVIGILLLVMALFLVVSILMQSGKSKKLSGTIAGGAEQFFGKQKGQALNKTLSRVTNIVSIVFVVLVFSLLLINAKDTADKESAKDNSSVVSTDSSKDASADSSKDDSKADASKDEASKEDSKADASKEETSEAAESSEVAESSEASAA